ncbi:ZIP family metal transporter [Streptomyces sp. NPDC060031]|uniref:ZIP family metal transporter n=1 Tax=Streptomyces sp. NPDC060031 TaxID=3347043 RepID=UPI0036B30BB7
MDVLFAALWGAAGAVSLVIGAWVAVHRRPPKRQVGLVMGFGSGALIAAVAYELVPPGGELSLWAFIALAGGAVVFFFVDRAASASSTGSADRSIVIGALLDGVPESMVLGMGVAAGGHVSIAFLVAVFLSNMPESLGATSGMLASGKTPRQAYRTWWSLVAVAAASAAVGYGILQLLPEADGHFAEAFAAGSVLAMLATSMMPEAYQRGGKATGLLTVLGFAVAGILSALG